MKGGPSQSLNQTSQGGSRSWARASPSRGRDGGEGCAGAGNGDGMGMETGGGWYVPRLRLQVFRRVAAELTGDPNF
jgi:hypothetical protein